MPYVRRKRSYRKSSYRKRPVASRKVPRRTRRYHKRGRVSRVATEFPSSMRIKLRYAADDTVGVSSGSGAVRTYSVNSPFDPYVSVGGGSCSGFAQWAGMYRKYVCHSCRVVVTGVVTDNDNSTLVVGIRGRSSSSGLPGSAALYGDWLVESKGSAYRRIPPWVSPQPYHRFTLVKYFTVKELEGWSNLDDSDWSADVTADPPGQPVFDLVAGYTTGTGTCTIEYHTSITYYTKFFQPKLSEDVAV